MKLSWTGSRCGTSTKAMPLSAGMAANSLLKASSPPAEAPIPAMGKPDARGLSSTGAAAACTSVLSGGFLATSAALDFFELFDRLCLRCFCAITDLHYPQYRLTNHSPLLRRGSRGGVRKALFSDYRRPPS